MRFSISVFFFFLMNVQSCNFISYAFQDRVTKFTTVELLQRGIISTYTHLVIYQTHPNIRNSNGWNFQFVSHGNRNQQQKKLWPPIFLNWFQEWKTRYCRRCYRIAITIPEAILHVTGRAWSIRTVWIDSSLRQKLMLNRLLTYIRGVRKPHNIQVSMYLLIPYEWGAVLLQTSW